MTEDPLDKKMTEILDLLAEPSTDLDEEAYKADERQYLATVTNLSLGLDKRAQALDILTSFMDNGGSLYLHDEVENAVLDLITSDQNLAQQNWNNNPLAVSIFKFAGALLHRQPSYPKTVPKALADFINKKNGAETSAPAP